MCEETSADPFVFGLALLSCRPFSNPNGNGPAGGNENKKTNEQVGSRVCAAWWPDRASRRGNRNASWHRGTVRAYREEEASFGYGPQRFYHVAYDDGDELEGVEDHFVFSALDYDLMERNDFKSEWIGLRNVCDEEEGGDKWGELCDDDAAAARRRVRTIDD